MDDRIKFADLVAQAYVAAAAIGYEHAQLIVVDRRKLMNVSKFDGWELAAQPAPRADVVPGKVHCAVCGFTLLRTNLYVNSGTTGPGDERCEPCPNDGNPLLPMTWEQEAREATAMAEQMFDRAKAAEDVLEFAAQHLSSDWPLRCQEIVRRARRVFPPPDQADHVPDARKMVGEERTDSVGVPLSCGGPLCSPGEHHALCSQHPSALPDDAIAVNLMRMAGLDKHKARECAAIVRQVLVAQSAQPVAFQSRFVENGDSGWAPCSREHYEQVKANPADWKGYECRALYSKPASPLTEAYPHAYLLVKLSKVMPLFQEARDALTAITEVQRKARGISASLADRMDEAGTYSIDDWERARADSVEGGAA